MGFEVKITPAIERQILEDLRNGQTNLELSKKYGVSRSTITRVKYGENHISQTRGAHVMRDGRKEKKPVISKVDTHLCKTCRWWQRLGYYDAPDEHFCSYCFNTGQLRHSDPSECNKYEKRKAGQKIFTQFNRWREEW